MNDLAQYFHMIYIYDPKATDPISDPWEFQYLLWEALHDSHRN